MSGLPCTEGRHLLGQGKKGEKDANSRHLAGISTGARAQPGTVSGCKSTVEAAQVNVLWHRCSSLGLQPLSIKRPNHYHLLLAPLLLPIVLHPVQSLILFIIGAKLQALYKHNLGISCHSVAIKSPSGLGYRTKQGCKKNQDLLLHSSHHNSTETVLKKCPSHLLINKSSLHDFLHEFSSRLMHLEKSFQETD